MANITSWIKPYQELTLEKETVFCKPCGKSSKNSNIVNIPDAVENKQTHDGSSQSFRKPLADDNQQPCCSWQTVAEKLNEPPAETNASTPVKCTPGKILDIISPVPVVSANIVSVRRRSKQLAAILTTDTTIGEKKRKAAKTTQKEKNTSKIKPVFKKSKVTKKKTNKASKNDILRRRSRSTEIG
ncbi:hypothetical protein FQA39_LY11601 [Lamprigera yunnana]|nr:hypothetical protein FQA39_LY11601 [Lamprigera yunnana]